MSVHRVLSEQAVDPPALHIHAMNDLRFIRQTMERSASFTAVPGWGMVGVGSTAWVTAWVASHFADSYLWLIFWLAEAFAAFLIGTVAMTYKAHSVNVSLLSGAGGRFMMNLFVPIFTGIPLTLILFQHDEIALLPSLSQEK